VNSSYAFVTVFFTAAFFAALAAAFLATGVAGAAGGSAIGVPAVEVLSVMEVAQVLTGSQSGAAMSRM
jgi:hypothetical protein